MDIGLPDPDGRDLCQVLRARGVQAPIHFLTARDSRVDRLSRFAAGGDNYVTKPFDLDEVAARLTTLPRRAGAAPGVDRRCSADAGPLSSPSQTPPLESGQGGLR